MEWISVRDRLPKYGDPVLIVINNVVQNVIYMRDGADDCEDWFEPYHYNDGENAVWFNQVSHWMPLPEPPEKEL